MRRIKALEAEGLALAGMPANPEDVSARSAFLRVFFEDAAEEDRPVSRFERLCL